ncbi:MAG: hypothetical protein RLZZ324_176 [Candidatus Parcubacteria bacterium]|jgi:hypothetical protein
MTEENKRSDDPALEGRDAIALADALRAKQAKLRDLRTYVENTSGWFRRAKESLAEAVHAYELERVTCFARWLGETGWAWCAWCDRVMPEAETDLRCVVGYSSSIEQKDGSFIQVAMRAELHTMCAACAAIERGGWNDSPPSCGGIPQRFAASDAHSVRSFRARWEGADVRIMLGTLRVDPAVLDEDGGLAVRSGPPTWVHPPLIPHDCRMPEQISDANAAFAGLPPAETVEHVLDDYHVVHLCGAECDVPADPVADALDADAWSAETSGDPKG